MKKTAILLVILQLFILGGNSLFAEGGIGRLKALGFSFPKSEMTPPPLTAYLNEEIVELTNQKRVTILYFWSSVIPPSMTDLTLLNKINDEFEEGEILIAPINLNEDRPQAYKAAAEAGLDLDIYLYPDPANLKAYILKSVPAAYILDKNGFLAASRQGNTPWDHPDIIRSLKELAASGP
ncbi:MULTISPECIES: TlpA disulfide reductase family protein [unclassified Oceanispirochaeta]|uniref:TlpA disulfide reductase family protein n=1 Tax=unclassified Oceanispirochaeta TaxID=2635722 RepID=UPI000E09D527|nr:MULTISPECIES: TlpA disulfide reductase family protein [unclassified Oceanispirochaeta]MBF9015705.1 TlpA family protein disulfide reductase [Oceanispirochaeta sp. M2]NPD72170.1 TlpA family protein disulfide reductase [Oceanispirochaeta sp. M1]RDG32269.1 TlpA family protein disulfide reductase [Oceanispirochaeta sp. M1]